MIAPGYCIGATDYEETVGSTEFFGECAGTVDLVEVFGYAHEFCRLEFWPIGKDRDEKDSLVLMHPSIL